ncbi:MAG: hypothetical protein HXY49_10235 [Ignavibacteriaceae bacterium]|nr:hypothetical protein [Ignavibacteriaceae bacterium]
MPVNKSIELKEFMVDIDLVSNFSMDFISRLPYQQKIVNQLISEGRIDSYSFSRERGKIWIILRAESLKDAQDIILRFPLKDYFIFSISEITLHQKSLFRYAPITLN